MLRLAGFRRVWSQVQFAAEPLMTTSMVVVARKGGQFARLLRQQLLKAKWVYTGSKADSGYAKALFESNGMCGAARWRAGQFHIGPAVHRLDGRNAGFDAAANRCSSIGCAIHFCCTGHRRRAGSDGRGHHSK